MPMTLPKNEVFRVEALDQYQIVDTAPQEAFDDITRLAAYICQTPIAFINFVDTNRQWIKSQVGLNLTVLSTNIGFNSLCVEEKNIVVINDTLADERSKTNPLVTSDPYIRFYAGVPLLTPAGHAIGTLSVLDCVARQITQEQIQALETLSRQIINQLELRRNLAELRRTTTERQQALEVMRKAFTENLLLVEAVASVSDGILITDPNQPGNPIIYANPAFSSITGYQPEEVMGRNCSFLQGADTDQQTVAQLRQAIAEQREFHNPILNYRKDGKPFWNELKISPVFSNKGNLLYFVGIQTDITERKKSEQKIREQAALLDITSDAILVQDLNNQILLWNQGAERLYGWKAEEVLSKNATDLLYNEVSSLKIALSTVIEQGEWQGELHQIGKDNQEIIVASRWTLMGDEAERPKSVLVVNTDITQKKQLEAQFLRAQRLESIGTLASGIAHDLNNILTPILAAIHLLQIKFANADEQTQRLIKILEPNTKRGAALVKQVLSFARGVEGQRTILQVRHLLNEIRQIIKETFPKSIETDIDLASDLWLICGDATQLHQVLMNLCVNARDAMPNGGTLSITAENTWIDENYVRMHIDAKVGSYIAITVSDTGTGISPEILERIFEPFFTTKELGKGTGLGLSTVIGIIKSHDGFVNVSSKVGEGTHFKVYLPAVESSETQIVEDDELLSGKGELILIVDDEAPIREITKTSLETYNYRAIAASDGIDAIVLYAQHKDEISVVLLDMMMPIMDGITTIRTLQKINPQVKIIAVSGLETNEPMATSLGVKIFLPKPYTAQDLLKNINKLLSSENDS